jgi:hypothetical protein
VGGHARDDRIPSRRRYPAVTREVLGTRIHVRMTAWNPARPTKLDMAVDLAGGARSQWPDVRVEGGGRERAAVAQRHSLVGVGRAEG